MSFTFRRRLLVSTICASAMLSAAPALAQVTPAPAPEDTATETNNQDIVVTGSLIRNPNLVSSNPVNVIGEEEIQLRQSNVAEDLIRQLPGVVPSIGSAVNNGNGGASFVDLRGLGSNRNLVLIDGVRLVPANLNGAFDLNNIPLALIQRVDTLTGGASTTYGADAVTGVVNFITRQDFAGLDLSVSNQITGRGDGYTLRADATIGANLEGGRGNVVLSLGYQQSDPVYQGARDFSNFGIDTFSGAAGGSGTSVPTRLSLQGGFGTRQINPATGDFNPTTAFASFNFNPFNIFNTPFQRYNVYAAGRYEINDAVEVYSRALFSKNVVSTIIAPSGAFGLPVQLPLSNPFLTTGLRNTICAAWAGVTTDLNPNQPGVQSLNPANCAAASAATGPTDPNYRQVTTNLSRRYVEGGPRVSEFTTQFFDYRIGFRGGITDSINWDVFGAYGESENTQVQTGYTLNSRVQQSVLTTGVGAAATCQNPANGCIPVNWFGAAGSIQQAANAFLTANSQVSIRASLAQVRGTVTGDFGVTSPLASEPISFAVGGEYRQYSASQQSDLLSRSGDLGGAGGAAPNIRGGYEVVEGIGEVIIPLVSDRPFFKSLTVEGGVRYSSYTVNAVGATGYSPTTWSVKANWEPVDSLRIRGTYSSSVRAPNIAELFNPVNIQLTNLPPTSDPCAQITDTGARIAGRALTTSNPALAAICVAQGAPTANLNFIPVPTAGQAQAQTGGNIRLQPETSTSWTVGAVFSPTFLTGFNASIDYYNIDVTNAVSSQNPEDALNACFVLAPSPTSPACLAIGRDPLTGGLSGDPSTTRGLPLFLTNSGRIRTDGIDLTLNYRRNIGFADLALNFVGNWTASQTFISDVTVARPTARECVGLYSVNCSFTGSIQPQFSFSQRTTLGFDKVNFSLLWRYIDGVALEGGGGFTGVLPAATVAASGITQAVNFNRIPAYHYFDLSTQFLVTTNLTVTATVQNLFDRQPPLVGASAGSTTFNSGNTYPSTYDALGRRFAVTARVKF
ncbi:MAG: TonB-dependent receptor [Sphingomonas sp.]|nr:TonB-dependent receptor [Sphingomonas sp.]